MARTAVAPDFTPCPYDTTAWQEYVNQFLKQHWDLLGLAVYLPVPDRTHGDRGLEGFTTNGHGYQAYADINSRDGSERRKGQVKKITTDLKKLETNCSWWKETLQGVRLRTWTLVVPFLDDANVLKHARKKGGELVEKKLPILADDFQAVVHTSKEYARACELLNNRGLAFRMINPRPVLDEEIEKLESDPTFTGNMRRKIGAYAQESHQLSEFKRHLELHLRYSNYMSDLFHHFPSVWESIGDLRDALVNTVALENSFAIAQPRERICDMRDAYLAMLHRDCAELPEDKIQLLINGLLATWLGDCTLDF